MTRFPRVSRVVVPAMALLLTACSRNAEREIHLIPAGDSGDVYVLHDVLGGAPARYEGDARVYEIPADGILRSETPTPEGRWGPGDVRYFYLEADGSRSPILGDWSSAIHDTPANRADSTIGIYFRSVGSFWSQGMSCPVVHEHYAVGTKSFLLDHPAEPRSRHARLAEQLRLDPVWCSRRHRRRRATARRP